MTGASKAAYQAITHTKMLLRMYRQQNPPQPAITKKNPAMDPADQPDEAANSSRTLQVMNDPRVSAFMRFFNGLIGALTLMAVAGLAGTLASWQGSIQRLTFVVERLSKDVETNTNDIDKTNEHINNIRVDLKVIQQNINTLTWRVGRNERRVGGQ